MIHTIMLFTAS